MADRPSHDPAQLHAPPGGGDTPLAPSPSESYEKVRAALLTLAAVVLAIALAVALPLIGYSFDWAPHRLYKIVAGAFGGLLIVLRPTWFPYILCFLLPYMDWLPKSPLPFINAVNLVVSSAIGGLFVLALRGRVRPLVPTRLNAPIILFMGWMAISALYAMTASPWSTGFELGRLRGLWTVWCGFLTFFLTTHMILDRKGVWRVAAVMIAASLLGALGPLREALEHGFGRRTAGGIGDINRMGAYLAMGGVFALAMIPGYRGLRRLGPTLSAVAQTLALILPNSRGAYVGFLIAAVPQAIRSSILGTILLVGVGAAGALWAPDFVRVRVDGIWKSAAAEDPSAAIDLESGGRITVWRAIGEVIADQPILGVGFENLPTATQSTLGRAKAGHNLYLETAGEMGLIGLALLLWIFARGWSTGSILAGRGERARVLGRAYQGVILCILVVNIFGQRLFDFSLAGFFFLVSGLAALEERFTREAPGEGS